MPEQGAGSDTDEWPLAQQLGMVGGCKASQPWPQPSGRLRQQQSGWRIRKLQTDLENTGQEQLERTLADHALKMQRKCSAGASASWTGELMRTAHVADEGQEALHGGAVPLGPHPPVDLLAQVEQQVVHVACRTARRGVSTVSATSQVRRLNTERPITRQPLV